MMTLSRFSVGHNLNLDHAWEGTEEYGDSSGMMGGLSDNDVTTRLCKWKSTPSIQDR
jgi:hypothetical protein